MEATELSGDGESREGGSITWKRLIKLGLIGLGITPLFITNRYLSAAPGRRPVASYTSEAQEYGKAWGKVADRNSLYTWDDEEWGRLALFTENQGLPLGLMVALRKIENGPVTYAYGQISISSEIKVLYDEEDWQMAQGCRTARRILLQYLSFRSANWGCFGDYPNPEIRVSAFLKRYRKDFLKYFAPKWFNANDAERGQVAVRQLWNQWDKEHK